MDNEQTPIEQMQETPASYAPQRSTGNTLSIPLAIIIAGVLIAGAVFFANRQAPANVVANTGGTPNAARASDPSPVSEEDHVLGTVGAPIVIVEYSDTECPFCKNFHQTMHKIIDEYGKDGTVAWVYRHFPLEQLHEKARHEAEATECAWELGGDTAFWSYIDRVFEITPSNDGLDEALLPQIATEIGLDKATFESCLAGGKHAAKVEAQFQDGIAAGVGGTPHSFIITTNGIVPIEGAQPYASVKSLIESILTAQNPAE